MITDVQLSENNDMFSLLLIGIWIMACRSLWITHVYSSMWSHHIELTYSWGSGALHFGLFYPSVSCKSLQLLVVPFVFQGASYILACYFGPMTELVRTTIRWYLTSVITTNFSQRTSGLDFLKKIESKNYWFQLFLKPQRTVCFH